MCGENSRKIIENSPICSNHVKVLFQSKNYLPPDIASLFIKQLT